MSSSVAPTLLERDIVCGLIKSHATQHKNNPLLFNIYIISKNNNN